MGVSARDADVFCIRVRGYHVVYLFVDDCPLLDHRWIHGHLLVGIKLLSVGP